MAFPVTLWSQIDFPTDEDEGKLCGAGSLRKERALARLARAVFPGLPHHVTQRGNGGAQAFFCRADYELYRSLLRDHCRKASVEIWAWVLMPGEVHLIVRPSDSDGIRRALSRVHRIYAGHVHSRLKKSGHLWNGRFACVPMDEQHVLAAFRYIALAPVRAGLVARPEDWHWSSAAAQLGLRDDDLTELRPSRERVPDFALFLASFEDTGATLRLLRAESVGRPIGSPEFLRRLEHVSGRRLSAARPGRKPGTRIRVNSGTTLPARD